MCSVASRVYLAMFFFYKQKTAYEIPKRDWSSDVCSSDLTHRGSYHRRDDLRFTSLDVLRFVLLIGKLALEGSLSKSSARRLSPHHVFVFCVPSCGLKRLNFEADIRRGGRTRQRLNPYELRRSE